MLTRLVTTNAVLSFPKAREDRQRKRSVKEQAGVIFLLIILLTGQDDMFTAPGLHANLLSWNGALGTVCSRGKRRS